GVLTQYAERIQAKLSMQNRDYIVSTKNQQLTYQDSNFTLTDIKLGLKGQFQLQNAAAAIQFFSKHLNQFTVNRATLIRGLREAKLAGRLEVCTKNNHKIWLDICHNPGAAETLVDYFSKTYPETTWPIVIGMLNDKDWLGVLSTLKPICRLFILTKPLSERSWNLNDVKERIPYPHESYKNIQVALNRSFDIDHKVICVGSFYLVGEVRKLLKLDHFETH
ncbi:MAG: hypothetical protein KDD48_06980, partial [Bdellovibrionales bacterium]|nr:hypothetical protein [Bdellovibrionales bacterium]